MRDQFKRLRALKHVSKARTLTFSLLCNKLTVQTKISFFSKCTFLISRLPNIEDSIWQKKTQHNISRIHNNVISEWLYYIKYSFIEVEDEEFYVDVSPKSIVMDLNKVWWRVCKEWLREIIVVIPHGISSERCKHEKKKLP